MTGSFSNPTIGLLGQKVKPDGDFTTVDLLASVTLPDFFWKTR
jgi:hypothetical protein